MSVKEKLDLTGGENSGNKLADKSLKQEHKGSLSTEGSRSCSTFAEGEGKLSARRVISHLRPSKLIDVICWITGHRQRTAVNHTQTQPALWRRAQRQVSALHQMLENSLLTNGRLVWLLANGRKGAVWTLRLYSIIHWTWCVLSCWSIWSAFLPYYNRIHMEHSSK